MRITLIALVMMVFTQTISAQVNVQAVVDGSDKLVVSPTGLFWYHLTNSFPGFYGTSYQNNGPTYVNGVAWTPTWTGNVSSIYVIDMSKYIKWTYGADYGGYFDTYTQRWDDGSWHPLSDGYSLNRGTIETSTYGSYPAVYIDDYQGGQNVYSIDLVPEPTTMAFMCFGACWMFKRKQK